MKVHRRKPSGFFQVNPDGTIVYAWQKQKPAPPPERKNTIKDTRPFRRWWRAESGEDDPVSVSQTPPWEDNNAAPPRPRVTRRIRKP